ncbi:DsbA family protein [Microbacterium sp. NPDC057407]|uniref:DsbA family protein n=1 Tax=Microbacterium sp. NPDC057407 TaxID=3346120 RepID=UPI00366F09E8
MAEGPRKVNWFAIWVSVGVVVALVVVAILVVTLSNQSSGPQPDQAPSASNIDSETGAILFGTGPDQVDTYVDFMCPYCAQFEQAEGETISQLVSDEQITLSVYPVAILDRLSQGTQYSSRSASAMYSVAEADPDHAYAFLRELFAQQPPEGSEGLSNEEIVDVARAAGVTMTPELEESILSSRYLDFAQRTALPQEARGTPTLVVNGEIVPVTFDAQVDIVARLQ